MLDTTTRKRIDDCRDILVGKLPDPKAQIEQITIGLIYKFMDDMDKEAIELGGKAKFFSNYTTKDPENPEKEIVVEFEKYSWDKLFDTKVTAAEMLKLYSEAIEGMEKNPNIPPLFRDIFNNAYLPYRDPETLKLFLKTIGEFEYTHSEKLGDAFEYLLSVMGSQGDAGQFRTPRHIIDFLISIIDPDINDTVLDPACGTAGFLIAAYKHILLKYSSSNKNGLNIYAYNQLAPKPFNNLGDQLTPDQRRKLIENFKGYDISPDMVRLSLVNLYLHGFSDPHIYEYDTLSSEERWDETVSVIPANPPFMSPKGGIRPHKKFSIKSNRSEVLFVDYIAEHLSPNGRAGIIVPEGVIFQSGTAYKELRKMLVENYLYAVVSLPTGVFNPYSGVKTSILLMNKEIAKASNEILFVKIENDGYNLGAQRTPIKGGQLEDAIQVTKQFVTTQCIAPQFEIIAHTVSKVEIGSNGEYNLSGDRYKVQNVINTEYPLVNLGDICTNYDGKRVPITQSDRQPGEYPYFGASGIVDYIADYLFNEDLLLVSEDGANLLARVTPIAFSVSGKLWVNNHAHVLKFESKSTQKYIEYILNSMNIEPYITGSAQPKLNQKALNSIQIPLPPISVQEEIVAEIEGYQKIIDGAKMVVQNYKPKIDPDSYRDDSDWEMVELENLVGVISGYGFNSTDFSEENTARCIKITNVGVREFVDDDSSRLPNEYLETYSRYIANTGDLVISLTRTIISSGLKVAIVPESWDNTLVNQRVAGLKPTDKANINFVYHYLCTDTVFKYIEEQSRSLMQPNLSVTDLKKLPIPCPSIDVQDKIVNDILKEQELVNANKKLIEIFEQKIKDRIAKVWGTSTAPGTEE